MGGHKFYILKYSEEMGWEGVDWVHSAQVADKGLRGGCFEQANIFWIVLNDGIFFLTRWGNISFLMTVLFVR
jgi:hypothetical protein